MFFFLYHTRRKANDTLCYSNCIDVNDLFTRKSVTSYSVLFHLKCREEFVEFTKNLSYESCKEQNLDIQSHTVG